MSLDKLQKYTGLLPEFILHRRSSFEDTREAIVWQFPNGYGASLVCHKMIYGDKPEFAVLYKGGICYDTDVTSDVIPYAEVSEVALYLARVRGI